MLSDALDDHDEAVDATGADHGRGPAQRYSSGGRLIPCRSNRGGLWTLHKESIRPTAVPEKLDVFVPYGRKGASARVRIFDWLDRTGLSATVHDYAGLANNRPGTLRRAGIRAIEAEIRSRREGKGIFDTTLIHREITPFSSGGLAERVVRNSQLSVYDFDDALMWSPRSGKHRIWSRAENCLRTVRNVDRVIAGSEVLAQWASNHNSDVRLIPTCVDPDEYPQKACYSIQAHPRIVWLGSPSTEAYLQMLAPSLASVNQETGATLTVISAGEAPLGRLDEFVHRVEWTPTISGTLSNYDIAIAPLPDGPIERGKCAYKLLQYGAAGLPAIASPVGANATVTKDLGLESASDTRDWTDSLMDLVGSPAQSRETMGIEARRAVENLYSYQTWEARWLRALTR